MQLAVSVLILTNTAYRFGTLIPQLIRVIYGHFGGAYVFILFQSLVCFIWLVMCEFPCCWLFDCREGLLVVCSKIIFIGSLVCQILQCGVQFILTSALALLLLVTRAYRILHRASSIVRCFYWLGTFTLFDFWTSIFFIIKYLAQCYYVIFISTSVRFLFACYPITSSVFQLFCFPPSKVLHNLRTFLWLELLILFTKGDSFHKLNILTLPATLFSCLVLFLVINPFYQQIRI